MNDRLPPSAPETSWPPHRGWVRRLNAALARRPRLYLRVLRRWRPTDRERFAYVALVRKGDVVLDVGANLGLFTLLFSDLVGPAGRVHAFEPVADTFARLAGAVRRLAASDNIRLNQSACADAGGGIDMHVPGDDRGQASLTPHETGSWSRPGEVRTERVSATTLDDYVRQNGLERVDLIKCDVEGAELRVLEGADACLRRRQPLLSLEVSADWSRDFGYEPPALVRFLRERGYDWFALLTADAVRVLDPDVAPASAFRAGTMLLCGATARYDDRLRSYLELAIP